MLEAVRQALDNVHNQLGGTADIDVWNDVQNFRPERSRIDRCSRTDRVWLHPAVSGVAVSFVSAQLEVLLFGIPHRVKTALEADVARLRRSYQQAWLACWRTWQLDRC